MLTIQLNTPSMYQFSPFDSSASTDPSTDQDGKK
jgi:hypothetical protein